MLQPQTINRNSKGNDIQAYVAALYEIKYLTALNRAETRKSQRQDDDNCNVVRFG